MLAFDEVIDRVMLLVACEGDIVSQPIGGDEELLVSDINAESDRDVPKLDLVGIAAILVKFCDK